MSGIIQHPLLLVSAIVCCLPLMFPLARFFFDDMETFKREAGLESNQDRATWLLGGLPADAGLYMKLIGFFGIYAGAVFAVYQLLTKFVES